jgi:CheY-like chemotaxis protein
MNSESDRLYLLHSYRIVGTEPEAEFDQIVRLAAEELQTPVALVALMDADRAWFKAQTGLPPAYAMSELPRELTFCQFAFSSSGIFVVPDAQADERFAALPLVAGEKGFRFYTGAPLRAPDGRSIGTLCVLDHVPHQPTAAQLATLRELAQRTMDLIELRRSRYIQAASFPPFPEGAGRLLIVDDDAAVREFVCIVTRQLGYAVTEASSGAEALDLLEKNPGAFELVLTDVHMPGMDGVDLARALRKLPAPPRIAAMSGRFDSQIRAALRAAGVATVLSKPFSLSELENALQQIRLTAR